FLEFWRSLPGPAPVYNDLADTGYHMLVDELLNQNGIPHSDDPNCCELFLRLSRKIDSVIERMQRSRSAVVAEVIGKAGKTRVGAKTFMDQPGDRLLWHNDLFETVSVAKAPRVAAPIADLDVDGLIVAIRRSGLVVADGISQKEHERWYLEQRLADAG